MQSCSHVEFIFRPFFTHFSFRSTIMHILSIIRNLNFFFAKLQRGVYWRETYFYGISKSQWNEVNLCSFFQLCHRSNGIGILLFFVFYFIFHFLFNIRLHVKWIGELEAFCIFDYPIVTQYFAQYRSMFNSTSLSMSFVIVQYSPSFKKVSKFWFWFWCFPIWPLIVFSHLIMKPHVNRNIHPICYLFDVRSVFSSWKWKQKSSCWMLSVRSFIWTLLFHCLSVNRAKLMMKDVSRA